MSRNPAIRTRGAKSARLDIRVTPEELDLLRQASTQSHRTVSQLVLAAALREAARICEDAGRSALGPEIREAILHTIAQATTCNIRGPCS